MSNLATGTIAFSNLTEHDVYKGQSTGKFNVVLRLDDAEAAKLAGLGVKLGTYEGVEQRKFVTQYPVKVVDLDDKPVVGELPRGSEVRVAFDTKPNDEHGTLTYLTAVRVVSMAESMGEIPSEF
tara:strand:+ start:116 stop:487 length:372 start_codon:yes stop_codon:yes gene_type:complete